MTTTTILPEKWPPCGLGIPFAFLSLRQPDVSMHIKRDEIEGYYITTSFHDAHGNVYEHTHRVPGRRPDGVGHAIFLQLRHLDSINARFRRL